MRTRLASLVVAASFAALSAACDDDDYVPGNVDAATDARRDTGLDGKTDGPSVPDAGADGPTTILFSDFVKDLILTKTNDQLPPVTIVDRTLTESSAADQFQSLF